jgi:hypothetical protein
MVFFGLILHCYDLIFRHTQNSIEETTAFQGANGILTYL